MVTSGTSPSRGLVLDNLILIRCSRHVKSINPHWHLKCISLTNIPYFRWNSPRWTEPIRSFYMSGKAEVNVRLRSRNIKGGKNTSSRLTSQSAIRAKSAANEAQGCWNWRVGWVHWVHSGALRACFEPMKISSTAQGLTEWVVWSVLGLTAVM